MRKMKRWVIGLIGFALWSTVHAGGVVCVDAITTKDKWEGNTTGATTASVFIVTIDGLAPQKITTTGCGSFADLDVSSEHVVRITRDGTPDASFRFNFQKESSEHLRLWYNTFYGTWQLWKPGRKHQCEYLKRGASNQAAQATVPKVADPGR